MRFGIFDMIGLATTLVFALPVANVGVIRIMGGETLFGAGLVAVALAMVVLPQFFFDPGRLLRALLTGLLPKRVRGDGGEIDGLSEEDGRADN